ncbi:MAG: hypothetical protein K6T71_06195 [Candidatus Bipolaricaulota bacterium]|nr:hypothetical protein [Candidatus Bipolaricaulota bacterium]
MIRKQIYIERRHEDQLKRLAQRLGCSEAELIRQALDRSLGSVSILPDLEVWERERAFIRRLIAQGPLAGRRRWTRDELYEDEH